MIKTKKYNIIAVITFSGTYKLEIRLPKGHKLYGIKPEDFGPQNKLFGFEGPANIYITGLRLGKRRFRLEFVFSLMHDEKLVDEQLVRSVAEEFLNRLATKKQLLKELKGRK